MAYVETHARFLEEIDATNSDVDPGAAAVEENDTTVLRLTFRLYGSIYAILFALFCILRRKFPKFYNIRSWVPEFKIDLALDQHGYLRWAWELRRIPDAVILENCGMDALCFLRVLRFGLRLSLVGMLNSVYLIPVYVTAEESNDTELVVDTFQRATTSNVPAGSERFLATVLAAYIIFLYTMYLILQEFRWYTKFRHKFLSTQSPKNYTVYVSGIPPEYRSSYALADYFRQCFSTEGVLEAHVAMDIPELEYKVALRKKLVEKWEHAIALESIKGVSQKHVSVRKLVRTGKLETAEKASVLKEQVETLNREIRVAINQIIAANDRFRSNFNKMNRTANLSELLEESGSSHSLSDDENEDHPAPRRFRLFSIEDTPERRGRPSSPRTRRFRFFSKDSTSFGSTRLDVPQDKESGGRPPPSPPRRRRLFSIERPSERTDASSSPKTRHFPLFAPRDNTPDGGRGDRKRRNSYDDSDELDKRLATIFSQDDDEGTDAGVPEEVEPPTELPERFQLDSGIFESRGTVECRGGHVASHGQVGKGFSNPVDQKAVVLSVPIPHDENHSLDYLEAPAIEPVTSSSRSIHIAEGDCVSETEMGKAGMPARSSPTSHNPDPNLAPPVEDSIGMLEIASFQNQPDSSSQSFSSRLSSTRLSQRVSVLKREVTSMRTDAAQVAKKVMSEVNQEINVKKMADYGVSKVQKVGRQSVQSIIKVKDKSFENVRNFKAFLTGELEGSPRNAGFVTLTKLSTAHAALQMSHHPTPFVMDVSEAPDPDDIYWKNVGMTHRARQLGRVASFSLTFLLCCFWTIPVSFISSLTEIESLKETLPGLEAKIEKNPWIQALLEQLAPLLLLALNGLLPIILETISKLEGLIASADLEASVFVKMSAFQVIQTFFISAISGGIWASISNILDDPSELIDLLANTLPSQSTFFVQFSLVSTFVGMGLELHRVVPLSLAALRRFVGPRLTEKERRKAYFWIPSLEDPWPFQHSEYLASIVLYFMIFWVYCTIAPLTCFFLAFCYMLLSSGYSHQFVYNYPAKPDSGGKMWSGFIHFCLVGMLIAEFTLVGLLTLKKATIATPLMFPLIAITILFNFYIGMKHFYVSNHLPTRECLQLDRRNYKAGGLDFSLLRDSYLQPALKTDDVLPDNLNQQIGRSPSASSSSSASSFDIDRVL